MFAGGERLHLSSDSWLPSLTQAISSLRKIKERKTRKAKSVGYKKVKFKTATQLSEVKA